MSRWRGRLWPRANEPVAVHQLQCAIGLRRRSSRGEFWAQWATTGILCIGIQRRPSFLLWEPAAWPIGQEPLVSLCGNRTAVSGCGEFVLTRRSKHDARELFFGMDVRTAGNRHRISAGVGICQAVQLIRVGRVPDYRLCEEVGLAQEEIRCSTVQEQCLSVLRPRRASLQQTGVNLP